jgi:hypothetical protein
VYVKHGVVDVGGFKQSKRPESNEKGADECKFGGQ